MDPIQQQPTQPSTPPAPVEQPTPIAPQQNPGQTLGIIGIVLAFIGVQVVGLVLSILSFKKSKKVGASTTLGLIGIILNAAILLIVVPILILIVLTASNGIKERAQSTSNNSAIGKQVQVDPNSDLGQGISELDAMEATSNARANAVQIQKRAEAYKAAEGHYPATIDDFAKVPGSTIPDTAKKYIANSTPTKSSGSQAYYQYCSNTSAQVLFYDFSKNEVASLGLGSLIDDDPSCR